MPDAGPPLILSPAPHAHCGVSTDRLFFDAVVALTPLFVVASAFFGLAFLLSLAASVVGALAACGVSRWVDPRKFSYYDPPALVTALLLAFTLPAGAGPSVAALGGFFAVLVGRNLFGGPGRNLFNPAMFAYGFLLLVLPRFAAGGTQLAGPFTAAWFNPVTPVTGATPLAHPTAALLDLAFGLKAGVPGEISSLMIAVGAVYLLFRRTITWHAPAGTLAGALFSSALLAAPGASLAAIVAPLFRGGLLFAAVFVVTDPVTMPVRPRMRFVAGLLVGCLTLVLRLHTNLPEGVAFAVLAANCLTPFLDSPVHGVTR